MPLQLRDNSGSSVRLNLERRTQFFLPLRLRPRYFFSPQFMDVHLNACLLLRNFEHWEGLHPSKNLNFNPYKLQRFLEGFNLIHSLMPQNSNPFLNQFAFPLLFFNILGSILNIVLFCFSFYDFPSLEFF